MSSATPPRIGRVMSLESGTDHADDARPGEPDMYDALRDLFLGGPEESVPAPAVVPSSPKRDSEIHLGRDETSHPRIEALVLGHLPVQQSPWVMQYARDSAAQRGGPVGLLRIREGEATLDLVGAPADSGDVSPRTTLEDAIEAIAPLVKGLIIRVDATSEPVLAGSPHVDALTLLTGADQAAVLGAYRAIKGLVGNAQDQLPGLRLAIMGSTPDRAMPAAEKIQKAVEANLSIDVKVTACLARIGPGRSSLVFRGLVSEDIEVILERARDLLSRPTEAKPATPAPKTRPEALIPPSPPPPASSPAPTPVVSRLGHAASPPQARPASRAQESPLAGHIPGLRSTRVSCPYQAGVEFATDDSGALHLLKHAPTAGEIAGAVGSLLVAASWAKEHAALIAQALQRDATGAAPISHLLTSTIKDCRGLPEAGIRVHLLARVEVEGKSGWFCTEVG